MKQMRSAEWVAIDFGVISPNTRMTRVSIPVDTPMAVAVFETSPRFIIIRVTIVVISEDADRLTMLLPIRMALSIFLWFFNNFPNQGGLWTALLLEGSDTNLVYSRKGCFCGKKNADKKYENNQRD